MEGVTVCHSFTATCQCGKKITETRENQKEFIASIKNMSKWSESKGRIVCPKCNGYFGELR